MKGKEEEMPLINFHLKALLWKVIILQEDLVKLKNLKSESCMKK